MRSLLAYLLRRIAPKTAKALFGIDAELVCAFAADWNERIGAYGEWSFHAISGTL